MKKKKVIVEQNPDEIIEVKVLAKSIVEISIAMIQLRKGRLKDKTIILLIHDSLKVDRYGKKPTKKEIAEILDAMESLKERYVKQ